MSDINEPGFKSSDTIFNLNAALQALSEQERKAHIKKTNGIFELRIKNDDGKEGIWTIDLKKTGAVYKGSAQPKPDITLLLADETFELLAAGKLDGQKAFMTGKLKVKGNMMLATKLGDVLKTAKGKAAKL